MGRVLYEMTECAESVSENPCERRAVEMRSLLVLFRRINLWQEWDEGVGGAWGMASPNGRHQNRIDQV